VSSEHALPIIYRLNVLTGKKKKRGMLPMPHAKALADSQRQVRFSVARRGFGSTVHYRDNNDDEWQQFELGTLSISHAQPISFAADNPGEFFLYHRDDKRLEFLFRYMEQVDPARLFDLATEPVEKITLGCPSSRRTTFRA
jgi:hypothetical protein